MKKHLKTLQHGFTMNNPAAIEAFIQKYRLATSSKAKDFRITVEEAGELVACIATINANQNNIQSIEKKLDALIKQISTVQQTPTQVGPLDGGTFR